MILMTLIMRVFIIILAIISIMASFIKEYILVIAIMTAFDILMAFVGLDIIKNVIHFQLILLLILHYYYLHFFLHPLNEIL